MKQEDSGFRRHVILFAYACDPERGSEPGAGWATIAATAGAATKVTLITRTNGADTLEHRVKSLRANVSVVRVRLPAGTPSSTYIRYLVWTFLAARAASSIHARSPADIFHHATYASDWFINPLCWLRKDRESLWVLGPVGGASYAPLRLALAVSLRLAATDTFRRAITTVSRRLLVERLRRPVDVAIALNDDTSRALGRFERVLVRPNAVIDYEGLPKSTRLPGSKRVCFAGRGVEWKGLKFAAEVIDLLGPDWTLEVAGIGTQNPRLVPSHLTRRVQFHGPLSRAEALALVARSSVFILPSLHDSAPWAAGEAAGIGTPVVCLDLGGVSGMAGSLAFEARSTPVNGVVDRLAAAVREADAAETTVVRPWSRQDYISFWQFVYGGEHAHLDAP